MAEGWRVHYVATPSLPPAGSVAAYRVVRAVEPLAQQQIVDTRNAQTPVEYAAAAGIKAAE